MTYSQCLYTTFKMPVTLPAPKLNVSPLIRFSRWTALFSGIVYGVYRYKYLAHREIEIQKHENAIKEKHRVKMEAIKKEKENAEMSALGKEAGVV
ncbi:ATP synthase subunit e, mitochondrial-like [Physella acuta]|uniref:ATP synthase subunit e, mitochondrial-like n=1 Tax=Physella acuta TaxID=109671 RepID=UPI0027DE2C5A|nr:ATP synthase subunit e, mitochondrial-like [Physella acuta]